MGKSMEVSQKTKNIVPDNLATPLLDTYPKKTKHKPKRYAHSSLHCSTISNSQDMEVSKEFHQQANG